jgi:ribosomal protein S18 acetylase RimI-like enzyme
MPSIVELVKADVGVHPGEQGGGIGRAVLTEAEHQIRDEPVS